MANKNLSVRLVLASIIALAAWMTLSYRPKNIHPVSNHSLPDAFMEEVNATIMDPQGKPRMKIQTPKMIYFSENDTSELIDPLLTIYRKSPQPWLITAKYGKATQGVENVDFWDDVLVQHAADEGSPMTLIKTPKLTVHPNQQTAETTDPITLTQPNIIVNAIGMQADMKAGSIKLLSEAKGEYVPNS